MEYIRPNGTVVAVGLPPAGAVIKADVLMSVLGKKKLIPSYVGNRADAVEALRIVAEGHVKSKVRVEPFNYIQKAYDEMKKGQLNGRVVVDGEFMPAIATDVSLEVTARLTRGWWYDEKREDGCR